MSSPPSLAALAASFHCPACKLHFCAPPSGMTPVLLDCAHTVCSACMDALSVVEPVCCPVCSLATSGGVINHALAEMAKTACSEEAAPDHDVIVDPCGDVAAIHPACKTLADQLIPLLDRLTAASELLETSSVAMAGAKADLVAHVEGSIVRFNTLVGDVIERVNDYRASTIAVAREVCANRVKALEAQLDELAVSAGQLAACVAGGKAALMRGNPASATHALDSAAAVVKLEGMNVLPLVPLKLDFLEVAGPLTALADLARLRLFEVDANKSSVGGRGLACFAPSPRGWQDNVITVTCMEADGWTADWVTACNVSLGVKSVSSKDEVGHVASATVVEPGLIKVVYEVDDEDVSEVELSVSVCGVTLAGGPWRAVCGCNAEGVYVATLPMNSPFSNRGLAITSDGGVMVISNSISHQLSVYHVRSGSFIRSFGGKGESAGQFANPRGICMTKHNTVLVADSWNGRIQEVTLEGTHVKFIGQGICNDVAAVAMHGDVIAIGISGSSPHKRIMLFSYTSGALLSQFGTYGGGEGQYLHVSSITFTADGKHLLICSYYDRRMSLTTVEGVFVRHYDVGSGPKAAVFNRAGDIVAADFEDDRVIVFSAVDGTLLRSWGTRGVGEGQFMSPTALAISQNRLYVLDQDSSRVQVFE